MRQRISIARALAPWPSCVVLDEPVSSLDVSIKAQVMNLLKDLKERLQVSYVLIAHDLGTVRFLTDRTVVMSRGRMVEHGDTEQLFNNPLHPYTKQLLDASRAKSIRHALPRVDEDSPRHAGPDSHARAGARCVRCDAVDDACPTENPGLVEIEPGHFVGCARYGEVSAAIDQIDAAVPGVN
jgi:oligopeptide/dipeptide ABC transporter ATP-binding protein